MSTAQTWRIVSTGLGDTLELGARIGRELRGGETIELISDLGGGKTAFVRGLAKGLGSLDTVRSPSFTLSNQYQAGKLTLYHFDFYRLKQPGIMRDELAEVLENPQAIVAVEWPEIVENILPSEHLTIQIKAIGENARQFNFSYPENLTYLFPINS
jgi:tRNA threonylcarbamoyladenosine biosynthesis protein TsaE